MTIEGESKAVIRPEWLKVRISGEQNDCHSMHELFKKNCITTVCQNANCPNLQNCWAKRRVTFLILGDICTRNCSFCSIKKGIPEIIDKSQFETIGRISRNLNLAHIVLTSVTRDDLKIGGINYWADAIRVIKKMNLQATVETLIPDFLYSEGILQSIDSWEKNLDVLFREKPTVLNHNLETVSELYSKIRPKANYEKSLKLLKFAKNHKLITKSGLMLGLGETESQLKKTLNDLRSADCDILTLGQYFQPSKKHFNVRKWLSYDEFLLWENYAKSIGFKVVLSSPFVRSSFMSEEIMKNINFKI